MKDRRGGGGGGDRFAVFPFSMGCMSQSAVSVADPSEKKAQAQGDPSSSSSSATGAATTATTATHQAGSSEEGVKAAAAATPGLVAAGVSRLMKGIRSLSHMFAAYDGEEEEEEEREMVIGYPTDVQHVGHIGWDGRNSTVGAGAAMASMVNAFSLPSSLSLHHLDMAMDRAAAHASA